MGKTPLALGEWNVLSLGLITPDTSVAGAIREVKEELGITLDPTRAKLIYQTRRDSTQDFYDVWLFYEDIDITAFRLQQSEVINTTWVDRGVLFDMIRKGKLHPLIDYMEQIMV